MLSSYTSATATTPAHLHTIASHLGSGHLGNVGHVRKTLSVVFEYASTFGTAGRLHRNVSDRCCQFIDRGRLPVAEVPHAGLSTRTTGPVGPLAFGEWSCLALARSLGCGELLAKLLDRRRQTRVPVLQPVHPSDQAVVFTGWRVFVRAHSRSIRTCPSHRNASADSANQLQRYENALAELVPNELAILWFWPEVLEAPNAHPKRKSDLPRTIPELATLLYNHREAIGTALSADSIDLLNAVLHKSMGEGTKDDLTLQLELGVDRFISLVEGGLEKIDSYPEQLRLMRSSLDRVAHEIGSLPSAESINIDVKRLHDEMEGLRTAQARHEASLNTLSHDEERLQLESDGLRRDIARLTENKQKYRSLSNAIHMCRQVRDVLAMFVNDYRSTRIGQLQTIVNRKFRELTNSPGLIDTIEIDRNQVELKLLGRNAEMLAQEQSAGQKEILAFALIASVVELSNRQVPAIIDTPLARLDMAHRTNVLRRFFPYLGPQVIILATDTEVGLDEVNELSPILATSHHLHLDPQTSCTTIRNGYLDE